MFKKTFRSQNSDYFNMLIKRIDPFKPEFTIVIFIHCKRRTYKSDLN